MQFQIETITSDRNNELFQVYFYISGGEELGFGLYNLVFTLYTKIKKKKKIRN